MKNYISLFAIIAIFTSSCKKDDSRPENPDYSHDGEVITTAILTFSDVAEVLPPVQFQFRDPDGEGGNPATEFDQIVLQNSTQYRCELILLDETVNPIDTVSHEVLNEADEHLVCFTVNGDLADIVRTDSDGTYELGLQSLWTISSTPGSGSVRVVLKHQPGIKNGSCDPGDSDVDVTFDLIIE